jgi:hypothetical protein
MAVDERGRLELAEAAKRALGENAGITLMELLPPVGWADVATKHDLTVLRGDLDLVRDDLRELRDEFNGLRGEFNGLRDEFNGLRGEFNGLRGEFKDLRRDVDVRLERGFRQMLVTFTSLMVGGFLVAILAILGTALVR